MEFLHSLMALRYDDSEILASFKKIFSKELELKAELQENHAPLWDLDVKIENGIFAYILFNKSDKSQFFIMRVIYLLNNISSKIFKDVIFLEHRGITRYLLRHDDVILRAPELSSKMIAKGGHRTALTKQLRKTFHRYLSIFQKFNKTHDFLLKHIK